MNEPTARRGERRIRVALEFTPHAVRVAGMTLLDGPAIQRPSLEGAYVAHVRVDGATALLRAFDDPLVMRGARDPDTGEHSYKTLGSETVFVDVPISARATPEQIAITVVDLSGLKRRPTDVRGVEQMLEAQPHGVRTVATITTKELAEHPDWARLALPTADDAAPDGHFEIYVDRSGRYRWRLRRPDGEIVADSGQGYADRAACEADLRWIRQRAATVPIHPLDLP